MDTEAVINEFLHYDKIPFYIGLLKSEKWNNLTRHEKEKVFLKINDAFCEFLDIDDIHISFGDDIIGISEIEDNYRNIIIDQKNEFLIRDINYNQYITLYEYFYRVREEIQNLVCFTDKEINVDEELKEKWKKNMTKIESVSNIEVDFYIEDGEYLCEFQDVKLDAKDYASKIMLEIVRNNFDYNNSIDEQEFMVNVDAFSDKLLQFIGKEKILEITNEKNIIKNKIERLNNDIKTLKQSDLENVKNDILFCAIYPIFSSGFDCKYLVKIYREIINRIYDGNIDIKYSKNKVLINNNVYSSKRFLDNSFNIVLYECLRDMDKELRNNNMSEEDICDFKKKWVYNTCLNIDKILGSRDLEIIKYQPLLKLINKEKIEENLIKSKNGVIPLFKGGKK